MLDELSSRGRVVVGKSFVDFRDLAADLFCECRILVLDLGEKFRGGVEHGDLLLEFLAEDSFAQHVAPQC